MKESRAIMGMPITVEIADADAPQESLRAALERVFAYFVGVDERFSTYKVESEISRINRGELAPHEWSPEMREVFDLAAKTSEQSAGYFDLKRPDGSLDPSGVVKGWAIRNAAQLLAEAGMHNFYIDGSGDIASSGTNNAGGPWRVGIRSPFTKDEIVKVVYPHGRGIATSGTYLRGQHIYNPHAPGALLEEVVSLTVIGPDVCEADRFATAAFAMGPAGVRFIESLDGFEAYAIGRDGTATMTSGFDTYTL